MRNVKLTIEYDGANYCGWQKQANGTSIQEVIERALKRILGRKANLIAAGRTDSGVHAAGQVANFKTSSKLTPQQFLFALNANLPDDIAVKKVEEVGPAFNARFEAKSKVYRYSILNDSVRSPLERRFAYQYKAPLKVRLMRKEAKTLLGRHNFSSFQAADKRRHSSLCTVKDISIVSRNGCISIDIEATGFLYNMARNIVGTLIEVGRGRLKEGDIKRILKARDRRLAGPTAPAKGLCLIGVNY